MFSPKTGKTHTEYSSTIVESLMHVVRENKKMQKNF